MLKYFRNNLGYFLLWILAMVPIVIWIFMLPFAGRFVSYGQTFRSLGQITGLLGMALLSLNFILAARFQFLDKWFTGLNRVYIKHHIIGVIAFCLLLFHPIFLIIEYIFISFKAAYLFILPGAIFVDLGKIALIIFILLMVFTLYMKLKYNNWKNTHKFLGLVLIFSIFHMLYVPSDISNNTLLRYYMLGLAILGIFSYFYRTIFSLYKKKEYKYEIKEVKKINDSVVELILKPLSRKIKFMPGQFVFLRFDASTQLGNDNILSESHPFSISSDSTSPNLSLTIKTLGDYTSMVYLLKPGAICQVEGPFGAFSYAKSQSRRQIWVAGGIGITPFLGMARQIDTLKEKVQNNYDVDLYYSVKNESEAVFVEELLEISRRNSNFNFFKHFSEKEGYISAKYIVNKSENLIDAEIFLCGPPGFMKNLREQFVDLGFVNKNIHSEEFSL